MSSSSLSPAAPHLPTAVVALLSLSFGYWLGVSGAFAKPVVPGAPSEPAASSAAAAPSPTPAPAEAQADVKAPVPEKEEGESSEDHSGESDDESEDGFIEGLDKIQAEGLEPCKMVLVVRTDLGMTKGKIAAQCCHAAVACYKIMSASNIPLLHHWEYTGQAKIALQAKSEDELLLLEATAQSLNLCAKSICDAGRTQIAAGSRTVLAIGPAPVRLINEVTGHLKLL